MATVKSTDMSGEEIAVLLTEFELQKWIIDCEQRTCDTNKKKIAAWESIANKVNAVSVHPRTVAQLKIKLKNVKSKAKAKHAAIKKSSNVTGGGPPPKLSMTDAEEKVAAMYRQSSSWAGIPGGATSSPVINSAPPTWPNDVSNSENTLDDVVEALPFSPPPAKKRKTLIELQMEALETQIEANNETIRTMREVRACLPILLGNGKITKTLFD